MSITNMQRRINRIAENAVSEVTYNGIVVEEDYLKSCIRDAIYNAMSEQEYKRITAGNEQT